MTRPTVLTAAALVADGLPDGDPDVVVVVPAVGGPAVPVAVLAAAQAATPGRVVVAAAPPDLAQGLQGALAGVGRGWAVDRATLATVLPGVVDEVDLRWRLWNAGCAVVRAPDAVDAVDAAVAVAPTPVRADRVPLPSLRPWDQTEATVPTVTVVVHGDAPDAGVLAPWPTRSRVPSEVLLVGGDAPADGRVRAVADLPDAVAAARGALVWFVHADVRAHREAWARALRRFEDDRITWVQVAYDLPAGTTRSSRGLLLADRALGAPAFALVRTRALRQQRGALLDAWAAVVAGERGTSVLSHPVPVAVEVPRRPVPTLGTLVAGAVELARDTARDVRAAITTPDGESGPDRSGLPATPTVGWVGLAGQDNFGDDLVLRAGRDLLAGVELVAGHEGTHGTVLGGGTLLNADRYYQRMAHEIDAPGLRRLVLGTGVVSPVVKGWSEELAGWEAFLRAGPVGVRGPHSAAHLEAWAAQALPEWGGTVEVVGDPALALTPAAAPVDGLVVLAPIGASGVGQVATDDERRQVELLVGVARAARADGRPVRLLTAHAGDDCVATAVVRAVGDGIDDVVTAHRDLDAGLDLVAAADVVVGARLHPLVAAASAGTTFVGLAYRPKVVDFAASIGMEGRVAPIGAWTVPDLVGAVRAGPGEERHATMLGAVDGYRSRLRERAAGFLEGL